LKLDLAGLAVNAISVGGIETCIEAPELGLAFDIGRCPLSALSRSTVLFTHAHMDHMGGVATHAATRALRGMAPPTYVVPHEYTEAFDELFAVWRKLDRSQLPYQLVPLGPGEDHVLPNGAVARPFRSPHSVPCQGYTIYSIRNKLKPEYGSLSGVEIARLRTQEGAEVTNRIEIPELTFTGDTLIDVVEREEIVRKSRRLVLEVTFLDDRVSVAKARSTGHVHLYEVAERAALFENEAILMTHFSARYKAAEIVKAIEDVLPKDLARRVTPLLDRP
jgi:ribonuclease Z